jgi:hypothetical protein
MRSRSTHKLLTLLAELNPYFRHPMAVLNGARIGPKVCVERLLDDQGAPHPVLDRRVDDAVMRVG